MNFLSICLNNSNVCTRSSSYCIFNWLKWNLIRTTLILRIYNQWIIICRDSLMNLSPISMISEGINLQTNRSSESSIKYLQDVQFPECLYWSVVFWRTLRKEDLSVKSSSRRDKRDPSASAKSKSSPIVRVVERNN